MKLPSKIIQSVPPFSLMLLAGIAFSGCAISSQQRTAIVTFSSATVQVSDVTAQEFVRVRNDMVSLRSRMLKLGSGSVRLHDPAADLDGPLDVAELNKRLAAIAALKNYGQLLEQLATGEQAERLQASSEHLLASLNTVRPGTLTSEQSTAIGKAVSKLGGWFIEYKRKQALKAVILETAEPIKSVVKLLDEDFDPQRYYWVKALSENHNSITNTLRKKMDTYVVGDPVDDQKPKGRLWSEADVALLRSEYQSLVVDSRRAWDENALVLESIHRSLAGFLKAHEDMQSIIQLPTFRMIAMKEYLAEIQELVQTAEVLMQRERK